MTVHRIRDTMQFEEEYSAGDATLRIYSTKRPGIYGYQFAAILWVGNSVFSSDKTGGCGYNKVNHAAAQVVDAYIKSLGDKAPPAPNGESSEWSWYHWTEGYGPDRAMRKLFGEEVHHAHG